MRTGRKAAIIVTAWALVLTQAVPAAWAAGSGKGTEKSEQAQQKAPEQKADQQKGQEQKDAHAANPEKTEPQCQAQGDDSTTAPADGSTTAPADGSTTAPADGSTTAPADGSTTAPADGSTTAPAAPKANVNLTGRGCAAQHNPNVDANGQLVPGQAGTTTDGTATTTATTAAETEQAKAEHVAKVKAASREQAKSERAKGEKGAYLVYVNGQRLNLTPLEHSGRTLVPFRMLSEYLGATVTWEQSTKTITMVKDGHTVVFSLGSTTATVDGQTVQMQVAPELVNDSTTFVPLRFIAEALGADVDYDPVTGAITVITTPAATAPGTGTTAPGTGTTDPGTGTTAPGTGTTAPTSP